MVSAKTLLSCVAILTLVTLVSGSETDVGPPNLFLDPKNDPYNPLQYIASNTLTGLAFAPVTLIAFTQTFYIVRYGARWMLPMVIGAYIYAIGFGWRFELHYHPDSRGIYITEYLLIVLSPCGFVAADYILLGRLAKHISCTMHVLLPIRRLTLIFMACDVSTFVIQACGGGMSTSPNPSQQQLGNRIFISGLTLQLVSFTLFSAIVVRFLWGVFTQERGIWERDKAQPWYRDWRTLAGALALSCGCILIRSCYRVAELSQGYQGYLATTEAFFYALDTLPLVIATLVYVVVWPGWFVTETKSVDDESQVSESL